MKSPNYPRVRLPKQEIISDMVLVNLLALSTY